MARYTGPKDKVNRRFGVPLFGPSKALERRNYPPGPHGLAPDVVKSPTMQSLLAKSRNLSSFTGSLRNNSVDTLLRLAVVVELQGTSFCFFSRLVSTMFATVSDLEIPEMRLVSSSTMGT
jgi:hypothetical protein